MSHPTSRMLVMLELLQSHHVLTGAALAGLLEVDERTVRRYAVALSELGIPVTAARGRYGGYRLTPGFKLPPLMLTDDEAVAVALGLTVAGRIGLATNAPATASAQAKIARVLPKPLAERVGAVHDTLGFTMRSRQEPARPATDVLLELGSAIRAHRVVELGYQSYDGALTQRRFHPYGLVFHNGRWYAAGHDERSGALRTFRVDRVQGAATLAESFTRPDGFDAVGHVVGSLAAVPYAYEVEVLLEGDLAALRARLPETVGRLSSHDHGVLLKARAERLDGMALLLSGLGVPFTVLRPDELRAAVAEHAARLSEYARRTG